MQANKERWLELCEQAAVEQDPEKLLQLVREINDLLEAKQKRYGFKPDGASSDGKGPDS